MYTTDSLISSGVFTSGKDFSTKSLKTKSIQDKIGSQLARSPMRNSLYAGGSSSSSISSGQSKWPQETPSPHSSRHAAVLVTQDVMQASKDLVVLLDSLPNTIAKKVCDSIL